MKLVVKKGRTSLLVRIFIQDSSSTTGAGLTGLTSSSSGLVCYRARDDDGNAGATQLTLSAGTRGTWSSGGFVEKDATNMPGIYELGLDNAGLVTGSESVDYMLRGATNMAPLALEIQLVAYDPQAAANLGLTDIDATVSSRSTYAGGAVASVTGNVGGNVVGSVASVTAGVTVTTNNDKTGYSLTQAFPTNFSSLGISAGGHISNVDTLTTYTGNTVQTGDSFARLGAPAGASVSADIAAVKSDTGSIKTAVGTAGAGLTALGDTRIANLDATVSSRATPAQVLTTALTESYATLHAVPTLSQAVFEIRGLLAEKAVASTTLTTKKIDGSTTAETFTLDSATAPTSITRAS